MKLIKIIGHPVVLIALFCLLLISGKHFGGVYLLYLLLALPQFGVHALFAFSGSLLIVTAMQLNEKRRDLKFILNLLGSVFLVLSLAVFFGRDTEGYNADTFNQTGSLVSFFCFGLSVLCFLFSSIKGFVRMNKKSSPL